MLLFSCICPSRFFCRKQYCNMYWLFSAFNPTCTSNMTTRNEAVEGEYIEFSCERMYHGNFTSKMQWKDLSSGEDIKAKDESSMGTVKFSIVVEIKPSHNGDSFTCLTYFDKPQSLLNHADNIPVNNNAFNESFTLPKQTVYCKYWVPIWFELSHIASPLGWRSSGLMTSLCVFYPALALRYHKPVKIYYSYFAFLRYLSLCTRIYELICKHPTTI